jgi:VWFA-related protein
MLILSGFFALSTLGLGMTTPEQEAAGKEPEVLLRSTTQLVQVEVVVRDGTGRLVTGLTKEDFEVREDGKPQQVQFFTSYGDGVNGGPTIPPLLAGMRTNLPGEGAKRRGVTVVLVDSLNTDWMARANALNNLRKFLQTTDPDERIAIYTLGRELKIVQDFLGDARMLRIKLGNERMAWSPDGEQQLLERLIPEAAELQRWSAKKEGEAQLVLRVERTMAALRNVANHLGSTPGRKSLVWITGGVPLQIGTRLQVIPSSAFGSRPNTGELRIFTQEFEGAVRALTASNVAVYPINPRGLEELPGFDAQLRAVSPNASPFRESDSILTQLAERTGGRAYVTHNDILGALREVTEAGQATYSLGYYPAKSADDGTYRRISVRMNRPGLKTEHRKGYFAADAHKVSKTDGEVALKAAALDPLDEAVIGIAGRLEGAGPGRKVLARIDPLGLLEPKGQGFAVRVDLGVFQFDADGRQLAGVVDQVRFECDSAKAALLSQHGLMYQRAVEVNPKAVRIRLAARSAATGAIGTLTLPAGEQAGHR